MAGLSCWKLVTWKDQPSFQTKRCAFSCRASDNKNRANYFEIGGARKIPDGVDIIRVNRPPQPDKPPTKGKPARPPPPPPPVLPQVDAAPEQQNPIVEATRRGRGGKTVTLVKGLKLRLESMEALCKQLKNKLGSGGSVKDAQIEIQGDHTQKLVEELLQLGYRAKKSGR